MCACSAPGTYTPALLYPAVQAHTDYQSFLSLRFLAYEVGLVIAAAMPGSDAKKSLRVFDIFAQWAYKKVGEGPKRWPRG